MNYLKNCLILLLISGLFVAGSCNSSKESQDSGELKNALDSMETQMDSISYVLGQNMYQNFQQNDIDVNGKLIAKGLLDAYNGNDSFFSKERSQSLMNQFQQQMMEKQRQQQQQSGEEGQSQEQQQQKAQENLKKSQQFLEENKAKSGVKTTESGLQYKVLEEGSGASPALSDTVVVHYKGTLIDGTEFDNSRKRGQPAEFQLSGVIQGWQEGLQLMKEGAKYKLFIPPELGYGQRGAGQNIGPNEALIFDVELIEVK